MTGRLSAIAIAMFITSSCAYAQVGGMAKRRDGRDLAPWHEHLRDGGRANGNSVGSRSTRNARRDLRHVEWSCFRHGMFQPRHGKCHHGGDIELDRAVQWRWRRSHVRRDAAGISGSDHDHMWAGFRRGRQPHGLTVERFDACDVATGRPDDPDRLDRAEQSGPQPGPVSGNGQYRLVNVFRCLLMRKRLQGSIQCDAR